MFSDDELLLIYGAVACVIVKRRKRQLKRNQWTKDWLLKRAQYSHVNLLKELRFHPKDWHNYLRMNEETYLDLLSRVSPLIKKKDTVMRTAITPHERLTATLRYLATGRPLEDLKYSTIVSPQALGNIIEETCKVILKVLKNEFCKFPTSEEEWKAIARGFHERWNFPNCLGAIDGKHVPIVPPPGMPKPTMVDGTLLPYVFVADEAFELREDLMKPFNASVLNHERRICNYRFSRARRIVENVFGILVARFGVFQKPINLRLDRITDVVLACCALHNFMRETSPNKYTPSECFDEESNGEIINGLRTETRRKLQRNRKGTKGKAGKDTRDKFVEYFNGNGKVPWQDKYV
ncbi:uncharacterized protein LOC124372373 [Homalodisca vitripennis]|uniref:uncharacterized protein LOC124372373 n=1 Tax=Homalodisca vitripennis TaxID=197043 RepID=UPI001EEC48D9|nr:uncharacterized protein LOC124372373 [Homalodisca vitripennis]